MAVRTDHDLLAAVRGGDRVARERLFDRWLPTVLQWCTWMGGPGVDAEDVAHDVCLVMMRRLDDVYDAAGMDKWLYGITRRVLAQHRRKAWLRKWVPGVAIETRADARRSPAHLVEVADQARIVGDALATLNEREREVLVLCLLEDRNDREVAELLDVPLGTVKSRLRRGRQQFIVACKARGLEMPGEEE